jgi:APA family basic amino acid/polyamine antiporter
LTGARRFGVLTLASLVVANMVGAGIFTTSGFALADLGTPALVLWAWAAGAGIAVCGAVSYGMLARRIPGSGGEYLYLARIVHPVAGFMAGWVSLLAGFTGAIAFAATTMEAYLLPDAARPAWLPRDAVAIAAILASAAMHGIRADAGAVAQNLAVTLKLAVLLLFVALGAFALTDAGEAGSTPAATEGFPVGAFAMSLVWISLSYSGFNAAVYLAGEARDADRTVPRALLLGTVAVSLLYLALNAVFVLLPPPPAVAGAADVAAVAARYLGGQDMALAARAVIALALFTSVSAMVMAGPRVYARMADDGLFPRRMALRGGVPRAAIGLQAVLACVFVLASELQQLLSYLGFTLSLSAAATVAGLFLDHARQRRPPVASAAYPWVPAAFVLLSLGLAALAAGQNPAELVAAVVTLGAGALAYLAIRRG